MNVQPKAFDWRCSVKKGDLKNFLNFTAKNTCVRVSSLFYKVACLRPAILLKKTPCFPVNFAKFLRTPFFKEHIR